VLFHDGEHGDALIDGLARFGAGLPAHVLPLLVNEVTQLVPENIAAVFAYGGSGVAILTRARPKHDIAGLRRAAETSDAIVSSALGFGAGVVRIIGTDDPDQLRAMLDALPAGVRDAKAGRLRAAGRQTRRDRTIFRELAPRGPRNLPMRVPLAPGAAVSAASISMSRAARCAMPASPPARPARCPTTLIAPCCASPKACACSADFAKRPVPKRSSRSEPRLDFAGMERAVAGSEGRRALQLHRLRHTFRHQELDRPRAPPSSARSTGCFRAPTPNVSTSSDVRGLPRRSRGQ